MASPKNRRGFRLLALLGGTGVALLAAEAGLRLLATPNQGFERLVKLASELEPPPRSADCRPPAAQARLRELVLPSAHADLVYELRPGVETCFEGHALRVNTQGVRAQKEYQLPKPAGTFRVLLLGDSQAFGWGVADGETIAVALEQQLATETNRPVEVVNAGVPGYSAYQEAAFLEAVGATFEPDCAVVLFVANDFGLPHFLVRPPERGPSRLWDRVRWLTASKRWFSFSPTPLATFVTEVEMDRVPQEYRHMVGESGYRAALERIASAGEASDLTVVNVVDYASVANRVEPSALIRFQRDLGIVPLEIPWPQDPAFRLGRTDPHFSPSGGVHYARLILEELEKRSVCLPGSS